MHPRSYLKKPWHTEAQLEEWCPSFSDGAHGNFESIAGSRPLDGKTKRIALRNQIADRTACIDPPRVTIAARCKTKVPGGTVRSGLDTAFLRRMRGWILPSTNLPSP
jgi:hypothetical protein